MTVGKGLDIKELPLVCEKCGTTMKLDTMLTTVCGLDSNLKAEQCDGKKHSGPRHQQSSTEARPRTKK